MATKPPVRTVIIEWGQVRKHFLKALREGEFLEGQPIVRQQTRWYSHPGQKDEFEGGSADQTGNWLDNGYRTKQFEHSADYAVMSERRHFTYDEEEGELDVDRVFGGYDSIFLDRELRESRPGMRLMFEYSFVHYMPAEVIAQYGAWCASLLTSLESSGYDLVVDMMISLDELFIGDPRDQRTHVLVRVKQENERSNFTDWSALFAPTGYRQLGFLAKCLAAEKIGKKCDYHFGTTIGGKDWGLTYDREMATVTVNVNQRDTIKRAPVDRLNEDAIAEGLLPGPIRIAGVNDK